MDVQTLGKYEIRGTLGRGAMGTVYDGFDPLIARRVAIKTVPLPEDPDPETAEEIARFKREAQAAGRLTHPNIVGVYDYGETSDMAYIVMEFVEGPSLKGLLDKQERFALPELRRVMEGLLSGLQFSHERGVVHRDIKPANVMLTKDGQAKIADFGIARIEASSMTQAGTMLGTPAYMSPEQFMGQVVDARSDVYSAGVVLYQLLTGERPFDGGLTAIMHKVLNTEPPPPSQLAVTAPPALDAVVRRAMAKRPEERFASANAFAEAFRAALDAPLADDGEATMIGGAPFTSAPAPTSAPGAAALPRPAQPAPAAQTPATKSAGSRMPLFASVAIVALLAIGGGGYVLMRPAESPAPATVRTAGATTAPAPTPAPTPTSAPAPQATPVEQAPVTQAKAEPTAPAPQHPAPAAPQTTAPQTTAPQTTAPQTTAPQTTAPQTTAQPAPVAAQAPAAKAAEPAQPAPSDTAASVPPAAPAPAPAKPEPTPRQLAMAGLAPVRQMLEQAHCAAADAAVQDRGRLSISGLIGRAETASLRTQADQAANGAPLDWQAQAVDPVFCTALDTIHTAALTPAGMALTLAGGRTALRDGQRIMPRVTMPDFAGDVRVDYLGHDGSVAHLFPLTADPSQKIAAQPSRRFAPGERLALGDPGPGKPAWEVGPPYGTDIIIAVASAKPLQHISPAQNAEENAGAYLRELAAAIVAAQQAGTKVAATVITVDTLPK